MRGSAGRLRELSLELPPGSWNVKRAERRVQW